MASRLFSKSLWLVFAAFVCISLDSTLYAGYLFIKATAGDSTKSAGRQPHIPA